MTYLSKETLHDLRIEDQLFSLFVHSRAETIFHKFQFSHGRHVRGASQERYRALSKLHLLVKTVNRVDVTAHKSGVNEFIHTEIIKNQKILL